MTRINCAYGPCAYGPAARPTVLPPQEDSGCHNGCRAQEPDYHQRAIVRRAAGLHESGGRAGCHGANATGSPLGPSLASNRWLWSDGSYAGVLRAITEAFPSPNNIATDAAAGRSLTHCRASIRGRGIHLEHQPSVSDSGRWQALLGDLSSAQLGGRGAAAGRARRRGDTVHPLTTLTGRIRVVLRLAVTFSSTRRNGEFTVVISQKAVGPEHCATRCSRRLSAVHDITRPSGTYV